MDTSDQRVPQYFPQSVQEQHAESDMASTIPSSEMDAYAKLNVGDWQHAREKQMLQAMVTKHKLHLSVGIQMIQQSRDVVHDLQWSKRKTSPR